MLSGHSNHCPVQDLDASKDRIFKNDSCQTVFLKLTQLGLSAWSLSSFTCVRVSVPSQIYQYCCVVWLEAIQLCSCYPHPIHSKCPRADLLNVQPRDILLQYQMTTTLSCPHTKWKLRACRPVVAVTIKQNKAIKIVSDIKCLLECSKSFRQWKVHLWSVRRSCHQILRSVTHQKPCVRTTEDYGEDQPPTPRDPGSIARIVALYHCMVQILHHE